MTTCFRQQMAASTLDIKKCVITFVQTDRKAGTKHFWFCVGNIHSDSTSCSCFQLIFLCKISLHLHKPLEMSGWNEQRITVFFWGAISTCNDHWCFSFHIFLLPRSLVEFFFSQRYFICLYMTALGILKRTENKVEDFEHEVNSSSHIDVPLIYKNM